jgi:hypothetical protein
MRISSSELVDGGNRTALSISQTRYLPCGGVTAGVAVAAIGLMAEFAGALVLGSS